MENVYGFAGASAAWGITALLLRLGAKTATVNGLIAGTICTALSALFSLAGIPGDMTIPGLILLCFLLPVGQPHPLHKRMFSLLLSVSVWCWLAYCGNALRHFLPVPWAFALFCLLISGLLACSGALRGRFSQVNWEQETGNGRENAPVQSRDIWCVLILMAAAELSLLYLVGLPSAVWKAAAIAGAYIVLLWGAVCGIYFMAAYRQEWLTTLIDRDYRNEMQVFLNVIRSQRHDYNFHVQALAGLVNDGNLEECRRYLNNLVQDSVDLNTILPIKDPAIAALIFSFRTMALEDGIELHLDIQNNLSCVVTSVYETNKVIGNLLQNAIDEVRTHQDKSYGIHLYILKRGENCVIHVANKLSPKAAPETYLQNLFSSGCSTKEGHEGIGLSSIRNLLSRYRGIVYARLEDDIIHFVAKIPLKLQGGES